MKSYYTFIILCFFSLLISQKRSNQIHQDIGEYLDKNASTLFIGSSRTHHNFDKNLFPDSIDIISKPNLYALEQFNILTNLDWSQNNLKYIFIELQAENISTGMNTRFFWDYKNSLKVFCFTDNRKVFLINTLNFLPLSLFKTSLTDILEVPRMLTPDLNLYSGMVQKTDSILIHNIISYNKDSLMTNTGNKVLAHSSPNDDLYKTLLESIPEQIRVKFYIPYGNYLATTETYLGHEVLDIRTFDLSQEHIWDYRHLSKKGSFFMTSTFLDFLKVKPTNISADGF